MTMMWRVGTTAPWRGGRARARESSAPRSSFPYVVDCKFSVLNGITLQLREDDGRTFAKVISSFDKS